MILARRGVDVTVFEKHGVLGGRNAALEMDGFSFDTGPTFLHQKFTLDEAFLEAGRNSGEYLDFVALDPMTRLTWGEVSLNTTSDQTRMEDNIRKAFPGNEEGFRKFMADHAVKMRTIYPCLQRPYHQLRAYMNPALFKALPYVVTRDSVVDVLDRYFEDERLKLAFSFQSKYLGMSPWSCPALFSILSYTEFRFGIHHVQGGLSRISTSMGRVVAEHGGKFRMKTGVREIRSKAGRATGVILEDGGFEEYDDVIINADYATAATTLFGEKSVSAEKMRRKKFSCSTFMLYLGLDKIYHDEPHHHVIFADDYRRNLAEIQGERDLSEDMSIYVRNSSVTDPHVAPAGKSGLYILVPVVNTRHVDRWDEIAPAYREKVLDRIEARTGMKDLRQHIVSERMITPTGWRDDLDVFMGATFNLAHTLDQMLYLRPHNRMRGFQNVYLVGGGTHPGSGLPTIYESGRIASNMICDSVGISYERADLASALL